MKNILLIRHAKSSWADPGQDDAERPLNKRGRHAAPLMARWLAREGWRGDVVLCSAAQRTRETLELMGGALDAPTISIEKELYLASADALLRRLRRLERAHRAAAIIAHNPGLEDLARAFTTFAGDAEPIGKFPTAAIAWFVADIEEWRELSPNRTKLRAFATPASIADDET